MLHNIITSNNDKKKHLAKFIIQFTNIDIRHVLTTYIFLYIDKKQ